MKSIHIRQLTNNDISNNLERKELDLIHGGVNAASTIFTTLENYKDQLLVTYGNTDPNTFSLNIFLDLGSNNTFFQS